MKRAILSIIWILFWIFIFFFFTFQKDSREVTIQISTNKLIFKQMAYDYSVRNEQNYKTKPILKLADTIFIIHIRLIPIFIGILGFIFINI